MNVVKQSSGGCSSPFILGFVLSVTHVESYGFVCDKEKKEWMCGGNKRLVSQRVWV